MKKLLWLCVLFAAVPVVAQDYYPLQSYGLRKDTTRVEWYGGMVLPGNNWNWSDGGTTNELGSTGWTAGMGFTRNVYPFFALGLDGNYTQLGDSEKDATGYYRTGIATGLVTARINFFPSSSTRLYIPAGFGIGHVFARHKLSGGGHETVDGTDVAEMLGAGLEFDLDDSTILGLETRYYRIHAGEDLEKEFGKKHFHHLLVMLKLGFRF